MNKENIFMPENSLLVSIIKSNESNDSYIELFSFDEEETFVSFGIVEKTTTLYGEVSKEPIEIPVGSKVAFGKTKYIEIVGSDYAIVDFKDVKWWIVK